MDAFNRVSLLQIPRNVYFEKMRVLKAWPFVPLNNLAWNNGIGPRFYFVGLRDLR